MVSMTRAYITPLFATMLVAASAPYGCGVGGVEGADADVGDGDASPGQPDARPSRGGLLFTFRSAPTDLPTDPDGGNKMVIERADIWMRNVRAVGDAAPGDERTRIESVHLDYSLLEPVDGGTLRFEFPQAPPGLYSVLIAEVTRYSLEGTVEIGGDEFDYKIDVEVAPPRTINVDLKGQDLGSTTLHVPIKSDLRKLPRAINWNQVELEDGELEVDSDDPVVEGMNDKLGEVHTLDD